MNGPWGNMQLRETAKSTVPMRWMEGRGCRQNPASWVRVCQEELPARGEACVGILM